MIALSVPGARLIGYGDPLITAFSFAAGRGQAAEKFYSGGNRAFCTAV